MASPLLIASCFERNAEHRLTVNILFVFYIYNVVSVFTYKHHKATEDQETLGEDSQMESEMGTAGFKYSWKKMKTPSQNRTRWRTATARRYRYALLRFVRNSGKTLQN